MHRDPTAKSALATSTAGLLPQVSARWPAPRAARHAASTVADTISSCQRWDSENSVRSSSIAPEITPVS